MVLVSDTPLTTDNMSNLDVRTIRCTDHGVRLDFFNISFLPQNVEACKAGLSDVFVPNW